MEGKEPDNYRIKRPVGRLHWWPSGFLPAPHVTVFAAETQEESSGIRLRAISILCKTTVALKSLPDQRQYGDCSASLRNPTASETPPRPPFPHRRIFLRHKYSRYKTSAAHMKCHSGERAEHAACVMQGARRASAKYLGWDSRAEGGPQR